MAEYLENPHPSDILRKEFNPSLDLLAKHLGISEEEASLLFTRRTYFSVDLSIKLGKLLHISGDFFYGLQMDYNINEYIRRYS